MFIDTTSVTFTLIYIILLLTSTQNAYTPTERSAQDGITFSPFFAVWDTEEHNTEPTSIVFHFSSVQFSSKWYLFSNYQMEVHLLKIGELNDH